ncbi:MAG: hypothetical protein ACE5GE_07455 [Phycisphaerae bacterium]
MFVELDPGAGQKTPDRLKGRPDSYIFWYSTDRLNAHRSRKVQDWRTVYSRLTIECLTPYAPELNPLEYVSGNLRYHRTANHGLSELEEGYAQARHEADAIAGNRSLLRSFVRAAKLPFRMEP